MKRRKDLAAVPVMGYFSAGAIIVFCLLTHVLAFGVIHRWCSLAAYRDWANAIFYPGPVLFLMALMIALSSKQKALSYVVVFAFLVLWITWLSTFILSHLFSELIKCGRFARGARSE